MVIGVGGVRQGQHGHGVTARQVRVGQRRVGADRGPMGVELVLHSLQEEMGDMREVSVHAQSQFHPLP